MIAPQTSLLENDHGEGVLLVAGYDVQVTLEQLEALTRLLDQQSITAEWQSALDALRWSNSASCGTCTAGPPVVRRDNYGAPRCADCEGAAAVASKRAAEAFADQVWAGDCS